MAKTVVDPLYEAGAGCRGRRGRPNADAVTTTGVARSAITSSGRSGRSCFQARSSTVQQDDDAFSSTSSSRAIGPLHVSCPRVLLKQTSTTASLARAGKAEGSRRGGTGSRQNFDNPQAGAAVLITAQ